ncbi:unnamed protein product [Cylindrotheca closterium]|uniref:Uncharacterized protein n=1 Tax=Cylindrotheca closterium TaxID=2856 RepID=A0AAD2JMB5_9STRA|nr:unnamed protein product [Cylindrotheca closterium]
MIYTTPNKGSRKMVGFIHMPTETREVQNRSGLSSEAISNTWYSQAEISATIAENSRACFLLQRSKYLGETDDFCYRGLESIFMPDYRVRRQKVMNDAKDAVMNEQDRQLTSNFFDADLIAATYREAVLYATTIARHRGVRDEEEIKDAPKTKSLELDAPPAKKNERKTGLKVKFDESESSRLISCRKDLSEEEKRACWLKRNEYLSIKIQAINDINLFMHGQAHESDDFTIQGLEKYLPNLSMIRKRYRLQAVNAVFEEQELQELEGKSCPMRIAKTYQLNSIHWLLIARQAGLDSGSHSTTSNRKKMPGKSHLTQTPVARSGNQSTSSNNRKMMLDKSSLSMTHRVGKQFQFLSCA